MAAPGRTHSFELHEQPWCPEALRNALTEWLRVLWEYSRADAVIAPLMYSAIVSSKAERIVDLCSGGSGPVIRVQAELARLGVEIPVILTDKFPNRGAVSLLAEGSPGKVIACLDSVDATAVPEELSGFRTLFNSFHHFRPGDACRILSAACDARQPVGVFEITERTVPKLLRCFPASFLGVYLLIFRMRPRLPVWWLCTWVLPIIPLLIAWDGLISHFRSYTPAELQSMTRSLGHGTYRWEMGKLRAPRGGVEINFLIGVPQDAP
jgi:hypothetical protein